MREVDSGVYRDDPAQAWLRSLENGLLLEDRPLLIPWKSKLPHLRGCCPPDEIISRHAWQELYWRETRLLAGLPVPQLQVILYPDGWLDSACILLEKSSDENRIDKAFQRALNHLQALLGTPTQNTCSPGACEQIHEFVAWERENLYLSLVWRLANPFHDPASQVCVHISRR